MGFRTDLALEAKEAVGEICNGIVEERRRDHDLTITKIRIENEEVAKQIGKEQGEYITIEVPTLTDDFKNMGERLNTVSGEIKSLLPKKGLILVVGLGNSEITPDALGPKTAQGVLATRHISGELASSTGLDNLRPVAVLAPGVLGQTGIEISELILGIAQKIKPSAVIVIDALASRETRRLGSTVQISNTGIAPGSGIGNKRAIINLETIGVPVISMGVPTVVDALTLAADLLSIFDEKGMEKFKEKIAPKGEAMMVTPREIDLLVDRASKLLSMAINCALQPSFSVDDLLALTT